MLLLVGERCRVRSWRGSDVESLVRHANNPSVAMQLRDRFPHPYRRADGVAFLRHATGADLRTNFAIEVDGEAAGAIGFVRGADVERFSAEIGYWLGQAHWGRGVVTEALTLMTTHGFSALNILRFFALPFADNAASARVLEKAGYVREALLKNSCVKFGRPRDQFLYARVNENWRFEET
jgi:RimJ/RimL family protein N-acetyltransferase